MRQGTCALQVVKRSRCRAEGCWRRAILGGLCEQCYGDIQSLNVMYAAEDARESRAAALLFRACHAVRLRLWIPMLILVLAATGYLAFQFGSDTDVQAWLMGGLQ